MKQRMKKKSTYIGPPTPSSRMKTTLPNFKTPVISGRTGPMDRPGPLAGPITMGQQFGPKSKVLSPARKRPPRKHTFQDEVVKQPLPKKRFQSGVIGQNRV